MCVCVCGGGEGVAATHSKPTPHAPNSMHAQKDNNAICIRAHPSARWHAMYSLAGATPSHSDAVAQGLSGLVFPVTAERKPVFLLPAPKLCAGNKKSDLLFPLVRRNRSPVIVTVMKLAVCPVRGVYMQSYVRALIYAHILYGRA